MYIRQTTIKSRRGGEPYFTFRLVESSREGDRVRQRTLVNLGRYFDVPRDQWPGLVQRIEQVLGGQQELLASDLEAQWIEIAEQIAAQVTQVRSPGVVDTDATTEDIQQVDINTLELLRPRSVGLEHIALSALQQLGLDRKLQDLGINGKQRAAIIGNIIARMLMPSSELGSHHWLQQRSALGELMDFDYAKMPLMALYRGTDVLIKHKRAIEDFLYAQERSLFDFEEVITLYDLTNTFFEGAPKAT